MSASHSSVPAYWAPNAEPTPEIREVLSAYVDGELSSAETQQVASLLNQSAILRRAEQELRDVSRLVRSLPGATPPPESVGFILQAAERQSLLGPLLKHAASGGNGRSIGGGGAPVTPLPVMAPSTNPRTKWGRFRRFRMVSRDWSVAAVASFVTVVAVLALVPAGFMPSRGDLVAGNGRSVISLGSGQLVDDKTSLAKAAQDGEILAGLGDSKNGVVFFETQNQTFGDASSPRGLGTISASEARSKAGRQLPSAGDSLTTLSNRIDALAEISASAAATGESLAMKEVTQKDAAFVDSDSEQLARNSGPLTSGTSLSDEPASGSESELWQTLEPPVGEVGVAGKTATNGPAGNFSQLALSIRGQYENGVTGSGTPDGALPPMMGNSTSVEAELLGRSAQELQELDSRVLQQSQTLNAGTNTAVQLRIGDFVNLLPSSNTDVGMMVCTVMDLTETADEVQMLLAWNAVTPAPDAAPVVLGRAQGISVGRGLSRLDAAQSTDEKAATGKEHGGRIVIFVEADRPQLASVLNELQVRQRFRSLEVLPAVESGVLNRYAENTDAFESPALADQPANGRVQENVVLAMADSLNRQQQSRFLRRAGADTDEYSHADRNLFAKSEPMDDSGTADARAARKWKGNEHRSADGSALETQPQQAGQGGGGGEASIPRLAESPRPAAVTTAPNAAPASPTVSEMPGEPSKSGAAAGVPRQNAFQLGLSRERRAVGQSAQFGWPLAVSAQSSGQFDGPPDLQTGRGASSGSEPGGASHGLGELSSAQNSQSYLRNYGYQQRIVVPPNQQRPNHWGEGEPASAEDLASLKLADSLNATMVGRLDREFDRNAAASARAAFVPNFTPGRVRLLLVLQAE